MGIIVQKFGGTSVADAECIRRAAAKIIRAKEQGHQVVATVSAPAGMTDRLIATARSITPKPDPREMDMLLATGEQTSIALMCMTLHAMGYPAISMTGGQVGIVTDNAHTRAQIQRVETRAIQRELDMGKIVVVAGFQGRDADANITTLGRGASDLTAVAVAAALRADLCEIYTDVDGIYTADPRVVPEAVKLSAVTHDEILELASMGAKVLQNRSVEMAKKFHVPLCVRSTFSDDPGTIVCSAVRGFEGVPVCGAALSMDKSRVMVAGLPDKPGVAADVVGAVAARNINIDTIVQSFPLGGHAELTLLVEKADLREAVEACEEETARFKDAAVTSQEGIARVSAVGKGMVNHEGVAARMCKALGDAGVNLTMITTSEIYISAVVKGADGAKALQAVHGEFELDKLPHAEPVTDVPTEPVWSESDTMERFHVQSVECDPDEAELKILGVPDKPGQAARVLQALADAKVSLDVVLQNSCSSGISVTVHRRDVERAKRAIETMSPRVVEREPQIGPGIAKVTLSGVGARRHAGAASRVFDVLRSENINLKMIGTSEVEMTMIVPDVDAERAVKALRSEFKLAP